MQKVYFKATFGAIDIVGLQNLRKMIGDFTIEGHDFTSFSPETLIISFYTDQVQFEEGENRLVEVIMKTTPNGIVELDRIEKLL